MPLKLKTYQCQAPRKNGEGIRIGTVRFLPRGIKKGNYAKMKFFDVWFPSVAPSRQLLSAFKQKENIKEKWGKFAKLYKNEMTKNAESRQAIKLLAEIARRTPIAIGCYCEDEKFCHRSILYALIKKASITR